MLVGEGDGEADEDGGLTRCAARSVWLSLNQEPPIFFHKSPSSFSFCFFTLSLSPLEMGLAETYASKPVQTIIVLVGTALALFSINVAQRAYAEFRACKFTQGRAP